MLPDQQQFGHQDGELAARDSRAYRDGVTAQK